MLQVGSQKQLGYNLKICRKLKIPMFTAFAAPEFCLVMRILNWMHIWHFLFRSFHFNSIQKCWGQLDFWIGDEMIRNFSVNLQPNQIKPNKMENEQQWYTPAAIECVEYFKWLDYLAKYLLLLRQFQLSWPRTIVELMLCYGIVARFSSMFRSDSQCYWNWKLHAHFSLQIASCNGIGQVSWEGNSL